MKAYQLATVAENAKKSFANLKTKYPKAKGSLTLAFKGGQARLGDSPATLLQTLPDLFLEAPAKLAAQEKLRRFTELSKESSALATKLLKEIEEECLELEINQYACVEIIWDDLDFELIRELRSNEDLVDVDRTPQIGGIRIVLGTLLAFL